MLFPSLLTLLPFLLHSALANPPPKITTFVVPGGDAWPEAIATVPHSSTFYTVSAFNGQIFRGTLSTPTLTPFIDGAAVGNMTGGAGIKYYNGNLIIAGTFSGNVYVFSTETKKLVARFSPGLESGVSFMNDLAVDPKTGDAWISDSFYQAIWKIPGEKLRKRGHGDNGALDQKLELGVDLKGKVPYVAGTFNGNGIVVLPGSEYLVLATSEERALYLVNPRTGKVKKIEVSGGDWGAPDGLLYSDIYDTLYVVNGAHTDTDPGDYISAIELKKPYLTGKLLRKITSPLLDLASTGAFVEGTKERELLVANFQYIRQATGPKLPFTIVRIPAV